MFWFCHTLLSFFDLVLLFVFDTDKSAMKKQENSDNEPTQNHVNDVKKSKKPIDS